MNFETIKENCSFKVDMDGILTCGKRELATLSDSLCTELNCIRAWKSPISKPAPTPDNTDTPVHHMELVQFDKSYRHVTLGDPDTASVRLSVFFDNESDSHHIHFPVDISRRKIARHLRELSELILAGGK